MREKTLLEGVEKHLQEGHSESTVVKYVFTMYLYLTVHFTKDPESVAPLFIEIHS